MLSPTTYLGTLMLAGAAGLTTATWSSPDEQAIRRHIERYYFEGVRHSDTAAAHLAFHPVAVMYSISGWEVGRAHDCGVDVTGSAAVAKTELIQPETVVTDYLLLLKVDGEWTIVGKIFDRRATS